MKRLTPLLVAVLTLTSAYRVPEENPGKPSSPILQKAVDVRPKAEEPIILPPIISKQGPELALLMVPGAYINAAAYQPLGEAIQAASPLRLWVGLVRPFALDLPNSAQCGDDIELTLQMMFDQGMNTSTMTIIGGHSLGGVVMQEWIFSNLPVISGMILMASDLGRALASVPIPVLHITGDLDGLSRVIEVEPVFRELEEIVLADPSSVVTKPVVILEDLNHMLFASGEPPPAVQANDVLSPLSEEEGHTLFATHMSAFITATIGEPQDQLDEARAILEKDFADTKEILRPLLEMRDLTAGETLSPWASVSQLIISNLDPSFSDSLVVNDTLFSDLGAFEAHQPVIEGVDQVAMVHTYSMVTYPGFMGFDPMLSAEELALKLKRQEAVAEILSPIGVPFLNGSVTCRDINKAAISAAVSSASVHVTERYYSRGRQLVMLEDDPMQSGPQWLDSAVQYNGTEKNVFVRSSSLITALGVPFGFDGMYYCKLMPPSRALEYIMLDSLRGTAPALLTKEILASSQKPTGLDLTLTNIRLNASKPSEENLGEKVIHRPKTNEVVAPLAHPSIKSLSKEKKHFVQPHNFDKLPDVSAKKVEPEGSRAVHGNDLPKSVHENRMQDHHIVEPGMIYKTHEQKLLEAFKRLQSTIPRRESLEGFEVPVREGIDVKLAEGDREHEAKQNEDWKAENHDAETTPVKDSFFDVKKGLALLTEEIPASSQQPTGLDLTLTNIRLNASKPSEENLGEKFIHRQKPNEVVAPLPHPSIKSLSKEKKHFVQPQHSDKLPEVSAKKVELEGSRTVHGNDLPKSVHEKRMHDHDTVEPGMISKTREHKPLEAFKRLQSTILRKDSLEGFEVPVREGKDVKLGEGDREHEAKQNKDWKAENHDAETTPVKDWFLDAKNGLGDMLKDTDFIKRPKFLGKAEKRISERLAGSLTSDDEIKETLTSGFRLLFPRGIMGHIIGKLAGNTEHYLKPLLAVATSHWKGVGDGEGSSQDRNFNHEERKASKHHEQHSDHMDVDDKHREHRSDHKYVGEKHHDQQSDHMDADDKHHEHSSEHMNVVENHHEHRSDHKYVGEKHHDQRSDHMDVDEKNHEHRSEHMNVVENHREHRSDHKYVGEKHHDHRSDHMDVDGKHHDHH